MSKTDENFDDIPTKKFTTEKLFGFESDMKLVGFPSTHSLTPELDENYQFDKSHPTAQR